jgi:hypothetical protein
MTAQSMTAQSITAFTSNPRHDSAASHSRGMGAIACERPATPRSRHLSRRGPQGAN